MASDPGGAAALFYRAMRFLFSSRRGPAAWGAYAIARVAFAFLQMFPIEWTLRSAVALAHGWRLVKRKHFNLAVEHIRASYGDQLSPEEVDRLAMRCLECVTMFAAEAVCLPPRINSFTWMRYIELENFDELLGLLLEGRGVVLVTGHYGAFELPGHLLACLGFDVVAVMRPLDNEPLNDFIVRSRRTQGLRLLDKKGASEHAEEELRNGALVGFIGDQDAGAKGLFVDFFGRPASTYKSIGLLAMATGTPIVVGYARRDGNRPHYNVGVERIIHPREWEGRDDPLRWITEEYTSALERIVRKEPGQYLWIHRRWKSKQRSKAARNESADRAQPASP